jgi:membrane-bound lytic murein transglycosylase D
MVLQAFVPKSNSLERVRHLEERDARVVVVGSQDFFDYFEGQNGRKRIRVTAKQGDTLKKVGQRYGMTVGSMERINRRSGSDPLAPGETLIVYAPGKTLGAKAAAKTAEADELEPLPALPTDNALAASAAEDAAEAAGER